MPAVHPYRHGDIAEIVEGLYAGPCEADLSGLHVDTVISLTCECRPANSPPRRCYPIKDFSVEPLPNLADAVRRIHEELDVKKRRVYIHCLAGCGRTGTAVMLYLVLYRGLHPGEADALYRSKRGCGPTEWEQLKIVDIAYRLLARLGSPERVLWELRQAGSLQDALALVYRLEYEARGGLRDADA